MPLMQEHTNGNQQSNNSHFQLATSKSISPALKVYSFLEQLIYLSLHYILECEQKLLFL